MAATEVSTGLELAGGALSGVRPASGDVVPRRALVVMPGMAARGGFLDELGVALADHPRGTGRQVVTDATGPTSVPGVWAAGNVADLAANVVVAAAGGMTAGATVNADLVAADTRVAVAHRRAARSPCW